MYNDGKDGYPWGATIIETTSEPVIEPPLITKREAYLKLAKQLFIAVGFVVGWLVILFVLVRVIMRFAS
jgi:hypothetical protein